MRALVTGASGHVGSFVVRELLGRGDSVVALLRPSSDLWRLSDPLLGNVSSQIETLRADFDDASQFKEVLRQAQPQCVYHLAWEGITADRRNDPSQVTRNAIRSLELLEAAQRSGCKTFVGVGSQAEYGPSTESHFGATRETGSGDEPVRALLDVGKVSGFSAYGVSKLCVGLLQQKFCELAGMRGVWLRLLATYGPQDDPKHLIPSVIEQLLRGEKPALTLGEQRWDYLFISDAARAIAQAGQEPKASGFFDLGSGQAPSVRELVEFARDCIDPSLSLGLGDLPYRDGQVMHLQADLTQLQQNIAWSPNTDWQNGLKQTVHWHLQRRQNV